MKSISQVNSLLSALSHRSEFGRVLVKSEADQIILGSFAAHDDGTDVSGSGVAILSEDPIFVLRQILRLDGRVSRMLLLAPSLPAPIVAQLMEQSGCDILISDRDDLADRASTHLPGHGHANTRWLITTSGTTGVPKIVEHSFATVVATTKLGAPIGKEAARWGLLFEPTRFAGLQVAMQAMLGGGLLLAPHVPDLRERIRFLSREGCTHLSATPTLWRRCLMMPEFEELSLEQITVGGEIADDQLLRALKQRQPDARITHVYAATEIGVGFSVNDGGSGFPLSYLDELPQTKMKVVDGVLWAKPNGVRQSIAAGHIQRDPEGFTCTGDRVRVQEDRVYFLGRESSLANIGGVKIQIEDVEAAIRDCPVVTDCLVETKQNFFSGAVLALTVSLASGTEEADGRKLIRDWCKSRLPREAQPATIKVVDAIDVSSSGKISRTGSGS